MKGNAMSETEKPVDITSLPKKKFLSSKRNIIVASAVAVTAAVALILVDAKLSTPSTDDAVAEPPFDIDNTVE